MTALRGSRHWGHGMSRMFNMLAGAVATRPEPFAPVGSPLTEVSAPAPRDEDDGGSFVGGIDETPLREIGGRGGPVFSAGSVALKPSPDSSPVLREAPSTSRGAGVGIPAGRGEPAVPESKPALAAVAEPTAEATAQTPAP